MRSSEVVRGHFLLRRSDCCLFHPCLHFRSDRMRNIHFLTETSRPIESLIACSRVRALLNPTGSDPYATASSAYLPLPAENTSLSRSGGTDSPPIWTQQNYTPVPSGPVRRKQYSRTIMNSLGPSTQPWRTYRVTLKNAVLPQSLSRGSSWLAIMTADRSGGHPEQSNRSQMHL